ncbi:hypothetical protein RFI_32294 [Reticulomyxa filosa]|uniref:Uncharacterized protein n=1 Tax=Reticulomyxa filosa TaxID=46433 RepID=X6LVC6_RETFI|nr:hypothetical protein RFI_32294 [Reticulomyxa filosa]|eukprot:ETO05102.1 hypothetical protein RFI_32294 [Reticulomyxa filosa]
MCNDFVERFETQLLQTIQDGYHGDLEGFCKKHVDKNVCKDVEFSSKIIKNQKKNKSDVSVDDTLVDTDTDNVELKDDL